MMHVRIAACNGNPKTQQCTRIEPGSQMGAPAKLQDGPDEHTISAPRAPQEDHHDLRESPKRHDPDCDPTMP
eukprot:4839955-Pyramimonas_sp.AAC.1